MWINLLLFTLLSTYFSSEPFLSVIGNLGNKFDLHLASSWLATWIAFKFKLKMLQVFRFVYLLLWFLFSELESSLYTGDNCMNINIFIVHVMQNGAFIALC